MSFLSGLALCLGLLVGGCYTPPCANSTCSIESVGPVGWEDLATRIWAYYGGKAPPAPLEAFRWIAKGNCGPDDNHFIAPNNGACVLGDTLVWTPPARDPYVSDLFIMDSGASNGIIHHELLHAWLALSRTQDDGDTDHTRPEWSTLLPAAVMEVYK